MLEDKKDRTVVVDRVRLIETLQKNLASHTQEYSESMAGYKSTLSAKLDAAFENAKEKLSKLYESTKTKVAEMTYDDISKSRDYVPLIDSVVIQMPVPRSYAKEYEAAIDMANWDTRETLELTNAEFTCFVRDQWDWKSDFMEVSAMYKAAK